MSSSFRSSATLRSQVEGTTLKFCTWIFGKGTNTKQKNAKLVINGAWLRSRATSRSRNLLNIRATDALENGKIRESIAFDFQHGYQMWTCLLTSWTKKAKLISKTEHQFNTSV